MAPRFAFMEPEVPTFFRRLFCRLSAWTWPGMNTMYLGMALGHDWETFDEQSRIDLKKVIIVSQCLCCGEVAIGTFPLLYSKLIT